MDSQILDLGDITLKYGLDFEGVIAQLQSRTRKILCVEDGLYLRIYEPYGPFPFGLRFEHKHRRLGITEYIFRYAEGTCDEKSFCIFGRDNAETFCQEYVDDQCTSSEEEEIVYEEEISIESPYSEIFSSSNSEGSDVYGYDEFESGESQDYASCDKTEETKVEMEYCERKHVHTIDLSEKGPAEEIQESTYKL